MTVVVVRLGFLIAPVIALAGSAALAAGAPRGRGDTEAASALATVEGLLAAVSARDQAAGLAWLRPSGTATVLMERPDGTVTMRSVALARYADATPGPEKYDERMIDPSVVVDGGIAVVWGRYTFAIDGRVRHCGFQQFGLVREGKRWLVQNVAWSVRTSGCGS